ncbi:MAG TPA: serine/threonine-protein kinase [Vicinamibacteria bacterium]|nr:serine/threonine-protein kinase [Vicinamibacteria bacterium]
MTDLSDPRRERLKDLFERAHDVPVEERWAWLREACAGEPDLQAELESLLEAEDRAGDFLEGPALASTEAAETVLDATGGAVETDRTGRRVGPYRVVRELGRGGMGVVYLAARDDHTYEKQVAIKLVQSQLTSPALIARFLEERKILAGLDHVNIARLLDAGTTDDGLPYVVMEHVAGRPIDEYCRDERLSTQKRLELFQTVCGAVQYSHRRLVVHRDIKAGNILVTAEGVPKLLDFGIAKLVEPGEGTLAVTRTLLRALTPESASPEQVRGEVVTVASDVYSLGALLYRLLTEQSPYASRPRTETEIVRAICEEQPPRPSEVAPAAELRGDLDLITLKALRKEPERRYASARDLGEDVGRYLGGFPVQARPDTLGYRTAKFVRRHAAMVAAGVLLAASLAGGLVASVWQWRRAERAHREAEERFDDTRRLAGTMMFEVHDAIADLPGSTPARELIVKRALEYLDRLSGQTVDDNVRAELAAGYLQLGDVQGRTGAANLGDNRGALESYRKAVRLAETVPVTAKSPPTVRDLLPRAYARLSSGLREAGDAPSADSVLTKAVAIIETRMARDPADATLLTRLASIRFEQAQAQSDAADLRAAFASYGQAAAVYQNLARTLPEHRRNLALIYRYMGGILQRLGRGGEALEVFGRATAIDRERRAAAPNSATTSLDLSFDLAAVAKLRASQDQLGPAIDGLREALSLREAVLAADPRNAQARSAVGRARGDLAALLLRAGDRPAAEAAMRRSVAERETLASEAERSGGVEPPLRLVESLVALGDMIAASAPGADPTLADLRGPRGAEACSLYRRGEQLFAQIASRLPPAERGVGEKLTRRLGLCGSSAARR